MNLATVYKSTGSWYIVKDQNNHFWNTRIKGKFKIDKQITSTNPIAVGDIVHIDIESTVENTAIITKIEDRKNYIIRSSPHNINQKHIIASNLHQALILASIKNPRTSAGFIDRFLVTCETFGVTPLIVWNKNDIWNEEDKALYEHYKNMYTQIGYTVLDISVQEKINIPALETLLLHKTTLISGNSGVGKSSFINLLLPDLHLKALSVSESTGKGMHTTTFAEMYDYDDTTQIIDTPGIRELGVQNVSRNELSGYFPEMKAVLQQCKYNNCTHINEPHCAVINGINDLSISKERYLSYLNIFESINDKKY